MYNYISIDYVWIQVYTSCMVCMHWHMLSSVLGIYTLVLISNQLLQSLMQIYSELVDMGWGEYWYDMGWGEYWYTDMIWDEVNIDILIWNGMRWILIYWCDMGWGECKNVQGMRDNYINKYYNRAALRWNLIYGRARGWNIDFESRTIWNRNPQYSNSISTKW